MEEKGDEYYIEKVLDGDSGAFSFLVDRYKNLAYTLAYRMAGNREDAEEISQDAFVKVYRSLKSFRGKAKFSTWLYRIIYNTAITRLRIKNRYVPTEDVAVLKKNQPDMYDGEADSEKEQRMRALESALDKLPHDEKFILQLYYYQETKVKELATATGLSEANVKVKLYRARKKLRESVPLIMKRN